MRLIKMTSELVEKHGGIEKFFESIRDRNPSGKFLVPKGRLGADSISADEPLLFSMKGSVRYLARATSGRMENHDEEPETYSHYFTLDPNSLKKLNISLEEVERRAKKSDASFDYSGRGWNRITDTATTDKFFSELLASALPMSKT